jgi:para-aminobenzoate synthetase component 1
VNAAGEVYQACVCTQFAGRLDGAPVDFFVEAVERTSPARAAYLAGEWGHSRFGVTRRGL